MPIEIMELVVKAQVLGTGASNGRDNNSNNEPSENEAALETVEKAVGEMMAIMKRKNER